MKKILTIGALTVLGAAASLAQSDIYITGSTAFRANCFDACKKLYDGGAPTSANDGTGGAPVNSDSRWTFTGTMNTLFSGSGTVTIHANFTGSVQGLHAMANKDAIVFLASATQGDTTLKTNTASAAFSDVDSRASISPLGSTSFTEKRCCVLPFVFCKSRAASGAASLTNITFQQLVDLFPNGFAPLSFFTGNINDNTTNIYNVIRSLDSGTRCFSTAEAKALGTPTVYYYDETGVGGYSIATTNIGPALYGPGYVGGGDVKRVLNYTFANNQAIGVLSMSDAKGVGAGNWFNVLAYNGVYPVKGEITGATPLTNDYSPIFTGQYSLWSFEILAWPKSAQFGTYTDQNITFTLLNNILNKLSGTGAGSIDNEILLAQPSGATAVRLGDMLVDRASVGGQIAP